jgi:hypothetical protein
MMLLSLITTMVGKDPEKAAGTVLPTDLEAMMNANARCRHRTTCLLASTETVSAAALGTPGIPEMTGVHLHLRRRRRLTRTGITIDTGNPRDGSRRRTATAMTGTENNRTVIKMTATGIRIDTGISPT